MQVPRQCGHHLFLDDLLQFKILRTGQTKKLLVHRAQVVDRWLLVTHQHLLDRLSKDLTARHFDVERKRGALICALLLLTTRLIWRLQLIIS